VLSFTACSFASLGCLRPWLSTSSSGTQIYTHTHIYTLTHIHTNMHTCTHIHTHIHTTMHTYTHIHTHIHTRTGAPSAPAPHRLLARPPAAGATISISQPPSIAMLQQGVCERVSVCVCVWTRVNLSVDTGVGVGVGVGVGKSAGMHECVQSPK
jgi:hypothetical protein